MLVATSTPHLGLQKQLQKKFLHTLGQSVIVHIDLYDTDTKGNTGETIVY